MGITYRHLDINNRYISYCNYPVKHIHGYRLEVYNIYPQFIDF